MKDKPKQPSTKEQQKRNLPKNKDAQERLTEEWSQDYRSSTPKEKQNDKPTVKRKVPRG